MGVLALTRLILDVDPAHHVFGDSVAASAAPRGWDFLGSTPVPLRARMRDEVAQVVQSHLLCGGPPLKCCMPMGQGGPTPLERLRFVRQLEDFPKLLVSAEHGNVFNRAFHGAYVERGAFSSAQPDGAAPIFAEAGLIDPKGWIGVYAVAPFVLLIDKRRLGDRPVPRSWTDLSDPTYRGEVVFGGWRREGARDRGVFNQFFLLAMLRLLGRDGLQRLAANVPDLMHSAQMPRVAGGNASVGAVYVLPWAQADLCPRRAQTVVVWPHEGALAYPLWMTGQAAHLRKTKPLVDYFYGEATAQWLDHNLYPAVAPHRPGSKAKPLPPNARLQWLGWDYLRHPSTAEDICAASAIFVESRVAMDQRSTACA